MFSDFVEKLFLELQKELPGEEAHMEMAVLNRPTVAALKKLQKEPKRSAVLVLLYPVNSEAHFCLIQRPVYNGTHSGQIAFPGGKMEPEDDTLKETALREAWEEVGVIQEDVQILSELSQVYIPPSNFLVNPYIGFCDYRPKFKPQPSEVAAILEVPVHDLLNEDNVKQKKMKMSANGMVLNTPYFELSNQVVWGATAIMLAELKVIVKRIFPI